MRIWLSSQNPPFTANQFLLWFPSTKLIQQSYYKNYCPFMTQIWLPVNLLNCKIGAIDIQSSYFNTRVRVIRNYWSFVIDSAELMIHFNIGHAICITSLSIIVASSSIHQLGSFSRFFLFDGHLLTCWILKKIKAIL